MKKICRSLVVLAVTVLSATSALAQDASTGSVVRRRIDNTSPQRSSASAPMRNMTPGQSRPGAATARPSASGQVTERMQSRFESTPTSDADLEWMRVIYRSIDLSKDANAPLYFPDEPIDGQENLFRIIMRLLAADEIPAYEYLDGREVFTDQYRVNVRDMLDRFHIIYTNAKGSTDKHPKFDIDDSDVPANEVLSYYIVERWEFDRRTNKMRSQIEAICPVLHRSGDFGGEAVRYPMFWLKFDDLRPYLTTQYVFLSDDNNLATTTYDDYFQLSLYDGDIYKTRNLRNQSLMQQFPDPEDLKRAQDSIQNRLDSFENNLWVPTLEELAQMREKQAAEEIAKANDDNDESVDSENATPAKETKTTRTSRGTSSRSTKATKPQTTKVKKPKAPKSSGGSSSGAARSVRNRRK
ncbi:MAG: gliding motility protein GldN [Muribaculaceae bacterium]|nr:gliding motility protein GldN [Muribaculaceae bacterium]